MPVPPGGQSPFHPRRRDMLAYLGASVAGLAYAPVAQAQTPQATISARMGENQRFDPAVVIDIARQLSKKPFVAPPNDLPDVFAKPESGTICRDPLYAAADLEHGGPRDCRRAAPSRLRVQGCGRPLRRRGRSRSPDRPISPSQFDFGRITSAEQPRRYRLFGLQAHRPDRKRQAVRFRHRPGRRPSSAPSPGARTTAPSRAR